MLTLAESLLNLTEEGIAPEFGVKYLGLSNLDCDYTLIRKPHICFC